MRNTKYMGCLFNAIAGRGWCRYALLWLLGLSDWVSNQYPLTTESVPNPNVGNCCWFYLAEVNGRVRGQPWAAGFSTGRRSWLFVSVTTWRVLRSLWGLASRYACASPMNGGELYTHLRVDCSDLDAPRSNADESAWECIGPGTTYYAHILRHLDPRIIETFKRKRLHEKLILVQYW